MKGSLTLLFIIVWRVDVINICLYEEGNAQAIIQEFFETTLAYVTGLPGY